MKHGPKSIKDKRPTKRLKTVNTSEYVRLISTLFQNITTGQHEIASKEQLTKLSTCLADSDLLESIFNQNQQKTLYTAIFLAGHGHHQFLQALLDNENILNQINVHQVMSRTRNANQSAFEIALQLAKGGNPAGLLMLFEKIPYSTIMISDLDNETKDTVHQLLLRNPKEKDALINSLLQQQSFTNYIKRQLDSSEASFTSHFEFAAMIHTVSPLLFEYILLQDKTMERCANLVKNNPSLFYQMLNTAQLSASKGSFDLLNLVLESTKQSPFNLKLKEIAHQTLWQKLFIDLHLYSIQNKALSEKIQNYLITQGADIDELEKNLEKNRLHNAIVRGDLFELNSMIENKADLNSEPLLFHAICQAAKVVANQSIRSQAYTNALDVIHLLMISGADLEKEQLGLTPLYHAICVDLSYNTSLTMLLLETIGKSNKKVNINAQCTHRVSDNDEVTNQLALTLNAGVNEHDDLNLQNMNKILSDTSSNLFPNNITPLHYCLMLPKMLPQQDPNQMLTKLKRLIKTLLVHKADLSLQDGNGICINDIIKGKANHNTASFESMIKSIMEEQFKKLNEQFNNHDEQSDGELSQDEPSHEEPDIATMVNNMISNVSEMIGAAVSDISDQKPQIEGAIAELKKDYGTYFATTDTISNYVSPTGFGIPSEIIAGIANLVICPQYKSYGALHQDTIKLMNDKQKAKLETETKKKGKCEIPK